MPWKVCNWRQGDQSCTELTQTDRCEAHPRPSWPNRNGTTSRADRGIAKSGWEEQAENQRILKAHNALCYLCGQPGCTQVDHVINAAAGGPDTVANKRPICDACHGSKSAAEAARGRTRG